MLVISLVVYLVMALVTFIVLQNQRMTFQEARYYTRERSREETTGHVWMAILWPIVFILVVFTLIREL